MWRDWLGEYRRHPVPAGVLAFTGFAAIVVFAVVFAIRHTSYLPVHDRSPVSKSVTVRPHPDPTVTIIERATPTRTVVETPARERRVTSTPSRKKRTNADTPPPSAEVSPSPTSVSPSPTEDPSPTESPTPVTETPTSEPGRTTS